MKSSAVSQDDTTRLTQFAIELYIEYYTLTINAKDIKTQVLTSQNIIQN